MGPSNEIIKNYIGQAALIGMDTIDVWYVINLMLCNTAYC